MGVSCESVCDTNPCENHALCIEDQSSLRGYRCQCNGTTFSGMLNLKCKTVRFQTKFVF